MGGWWPPILYIKVRPKRQIAEFKMSASQALQLVERWLEEYPGGPDFFVVRVVAVRRGEGLEVVVGRDEGIALEECVRINRGLRAALEEADLDADLEVSSPGLTEPLEHPRLLQRAQGKLVEVTLKAGGRMEGVLLGFDDQELRIEVKSREKLEGEKRPREVIREKAIRREEIARTILVIDKRKGSR